VLVTTLILLPLLGGLLMALMPRRIRSWIAHHLTTAITAVTVGCLAVLLPHAGSGPALTLNWLPPAGPMDLGLGATGLYAALVTGCALFLVLLGTMSGSSEFRPLSGAVMLLVLAATYVAFLSEHFLLRYVALEVVALGVALVLLVEIQGPASFRLTWANYLLLRLGDAGLAVAILVLLRGSGTLNIKGALEAAATLDAAPLGWAVAGFVLAIWIKLGGWPLHIWKQPGRRLSLSSNAWLYASVMPNLGIYLLYRVAPLLALNRPLQTAALWLGAGGAAVAALVALTQTDLRAALVYQGAVQGGLVLFVASSGLKSTTWLSLLVVTLLRPLLFLAADTARKCESPPRRRVAAGFFALGGLALAVFGLLTTWWAREASAPRDAVFVAQAAVALSSIWMARMVRRLLAPLPKVTASRVHWTRWAVTGLLGGGVLAAGLGFEPMVRYLATATDMSFPTIPGLPALLRYALTAPAIWVVMVLTWRVWRLGRRSGREALVTAPPTGEVYNLEEGLVRAAQVLRAVFEVGTLERMVAWMVRVGIEGARVAHRVVEQQGLEGLLQRSAGVVVEGARVAHRVVEQQGLEGLLQRSAGVVVKGARVAHRVVELQGLEGLLQRSVRVAMALGHRLQRWQTGRLRHSLLLVLISLAVAALGLVMRGS